MKAMLRIAAVLAALAIGIRGLRRQRRRRRRRWGRRHRRCEEVTQAKASGDVTWCIGKDTSGAFGTVVDNFNKQNPDARGGSCWSCRRRLTGGASSRSSGCRRSPDECDVLGMDGSGPPEYAAQGWLQDITEAVEKRKDECVPSTVETALYEDKYWAMPFNTNAGFLYYRDDQVSGPPTDSEGHVSAGGQDNGVVYQGFRYEGLTVNFLELLYSAGASVVNEDATEATADSPGGARRPDVHGGRHQGRRSAEGGHDLQGGGVAARLGSGNAT